MRRAVVTGAAGQDGSILSELLLEKGYEVYGVALPGPPSRNATHLGILQGRTGFHPILGDIRDVPFIDRLVQEVQPDEYYNLAALSHVGESFADPVATFDTDGTAVVSALQTLRSYSPTTRFYQASTSELFGLTPCPVAGHTEHSAFHPRSPYGVAKLAGFWATVNARETWGAHASNGILFNHSSPRRGLDFATRKITRGVAMVALGMAQTVKMGDLRAFRDEGLADDYMLAAWQMLQQDEPGDYVVGTGSGATIEQMFRHVCARAGLDFESVYERDERFLRPSEVPYLRSNPAKAADVLGWTASHHWQQVLDLMFDADLAMLTAQDERAREG